MTEVSDADRAHVKQRIRDFANKLKAKQEPKADANKPKKTLEQELEELRTRPIKPVRGQCEPGTAIRASLQAERGTE